MGRCHSIFLETSDCPDIPEEEMALCGPTSHIPCRESGCCWKNNKCFLKPGECKYLLPPPFKCQKCFFCS